MLNALCKIKNKITLSWKVQIKDWDKNSKNIDDIIKILEDIAGIKDIM
jgi:hypothetical protein